MDNKGKIGLNGLDTSGGSCSRNMSTSLAVGFCIDHAKGVSRPRSPGSAFLSRRLAKTIGLLLVFVAAIVIVSAIVLGSIGTQHRVPANALAPPGPPYPVAGYTYDSLGAKLPSCDLNVTDLNTGEYCNTVVSDGNGFYSVDLGSFAVWTEGDIIKVTAAKDMWTGENQSAVAGTYLRLDVTLNVLIPEFPMVIVPVTGMLALVAVVSLRRRGEEQ